ncbi:hypothetical protein THASP1DRAFT_29721 [Thamnocephalis sphaerospora]|uniref:Uncharacterized protein n=1 Tax=Thamnocephalis sphaerospora TaxID=78915 RepID=A0A4P9XQZ5_9FUNG|nr:hypothetical protein THASP1DRAFT_29721 [Thamnocephalis sphaerospora]|eukprot:RKP08475.1 hypothetical protein THASP1DRAFT_29721 [Thamnocephalis sphaerospora]
MALIYTAAKSLCLLQAVFRSFKAVQARDTAGKRNWLQFWLAVVCLQQVEGLVDTLFGWLPFYDMGKAALAFILLISGTWGSAILYHGYVRPVIAAHERHIDHYFVGYGQLIVRLLSLIVGNLWSSCTALWNLVLMRPAAAKPPPRRRARAQVEHTLILSSDEDVPVETDDDEMSRILDARRRRKRGQSHKARQDISLPGSARGTTHRRAAVALERYQQEHGRGARRRHTREPSLGGRPVTDKPNASGHYPIAASPAIQRLQRGPRRTAPTPPSASKPPAWPVPTSAHALPRIVNRLNSARRESRPAASQNTLASPFAERVVRREERAPTRRMPVRPLAPPMFNDGLSTASSPLATSTPLRQARGARGAVVAPQDTGASVYTSTRPPPRQNAARQTAHRPPPAAAAQPRSNHEQVIAEYPSPLPGAFASHAVPQRPALEAIAPARPAVAAGKATRHPSSKPAAQASRQPPASVVEKQPRMDTAISALPSRAAQQQQLHKRTHTEVEVTEDEAAGSTANAAAATAKLAQASPKRRRAGQAANGEKPAHMPTKIGRSNEAIDTLIPVADNTGGVAAASAAAQLSAKVHAALTKPTKRKAAEEQASGAAETGASHIVGTQPTKRPTLATGRPSQTAASAQDISTSGETTREGDGASAEPVILIGDTEDEESAAEGAVVEPEDEEEEDMDDDEEEEEDDERRDATYIEDPAAIEEEEEEDLAILDLTMSPRRRRRRGPTADGKADQQTTPLMPSPKISFSGRSRTRGIIENGEEDEGGIGGRSFERRRRRHGQYT